MLTYRIYRTPKVVLGLFKQRLKTLIKINLIPATIIALGLPLLLYLTGGTDNILNYVMLFTTIISCLYMLSNLMDGIIKNYILTVFLILFSALLVSLLGFEIIVTYVYSIIGIVGLIFITFISKKEREIYIAKISRKK
jgi:uncharacterized membrane protein YkvI